MTEKEKGPKSNKVKDVVWHWARKGLSPRSMAAKAGIAYEEFINILNFEENGMRPVRLIYDAARAEYESTRLDIRDEILFDPETSKGLKAKILRDDLKEFEEHAPATRAVRIQTEEGATVITFEALTNDEQNEIKNAHKSDAINTDEIDESNVEKE